VTKRQTKNKLTETEGQKDRKTERQKDRKTERQTKKPDKNVRVAGNTKFKTKRQNGPEMLQRKKRIIFPNHAISQNWTCHLKKLIIFISGSRPSSHLHLNQRSLPGRLLK
jgi:hypothetical protein